MFPLVVFGWGFGSDVERREVSPTRLGRLGHVKGFRPTRFMGGSKTQLSPTVARLEEEGRGGWGLRLLFCR